MKQDNFIRDAIDESLSGVHFNAHDMRTVLRAAKTREDEPARAPRSRRPLRLELAFSMAMMLLLVVPIGWFALRAQGMRTTAIVASPGAATLSPQTTVDLQADLILSTAAPDYTADESEAIRIARACFEEHCNTAIFTFEEYALSVIPGENGAYTVVMESIYGNGCRFTVEVSVKDASVLAYSTPHLATVPTYLDASAPQIRAWYDKNGPYLITWPQETQAEFSRRYEGAALRTARPGELTAGEAAELAAKHAREALGLAPDAPVYAYPMLYAGDSAWYVVSCFASPVTQEMPEAIATVVFSPAGDDVTVTPEE